MSHLPKSDSSVTKRLTSEDLARLADGTHLRLYEVLGAHLDEPDGTRFAVWAPSASAVSVIGDFNGWQPGASPLSPTKSSGVWEAKVADAGHGSLYKYHITSSDGSYQVEKADPVGFRHETPPRTASVVWDLAYQWGDRKWMTNRSAANALDAPMSVYELHMGSWRRKGGKFLSYRELAGQLIDYVSRLGFTHVELLPPMEHPFYGSWGYQVTGYFAPTNRYGSPQDFMYLIDVLHQNGIGVILDWVPSHFATDEHGLGRFDGSHLYEHADPRVAVHPDWGSLIFNYGRHEVRAFLTSSAMFWLDRYHVDGLRVDAVASMLYLDYSRQEGEWIANRYGGNENLDGVSFLKHLNTSVYAAHPDTQTIAEESTSWFRVTRPIEMGGLGFGLKWDMGWMHDTLRYLAKDPIHRQHHQDELTFRMLYAFNENFALPLSHDEVVHGKGSLASRMPGDDWQNLANLRLLLAYQHALPGKKLLFMGGEFGQWAEWDHEQELDWDLTAHDRHKGLQDLVSDLNRLHRDRPALHQFDYEPSAFSWIDTSDHAASVVSLLRDEPDGDPVLVVFNFTPTPRFDYRIGVPRSGRWDELVNTDASEYGGSGMGNLGGVEASEESSHGHPHSLVLTLPPLAALFLAPS